MVSRKSLYYLLKAYNLNIKIKFKIKKFQNRSLHPKPPWQGYVHWMEAEHAGRARAKPPFDHISMGLTMQVPLILPLYHL